MQLKVGDIVEGKVTGITNFGLFLDIGDGKSGMVHISEVAHSYVSDIHEHFKVNDTVKAKILTVSDEGKISVSIKRATEPENRSRDAGHKRERKQYEQPKPDGSFTWMPKKQESASFEEMMSRFKQTSDEKFSDLKRKNPDERRTKRGSGGR